MFSKTLRADLFRYKGIDKNKTYITSILSHSGARFMFLYRMCNKYKTMHPLGIFFRVWLKILNNKRNVEIPHATSIRQGLYMGHFKNIIINQNSFIGPNCNISHNVTIGSESRGKRIGCPRIGERVSIGPNSVIVGNITIGNDVLIGPLTLVNFDVPNNSVVIGNPGKIISDKGSEGYINKILP